MKTTIKRWKVPVIRWAMRQLKPLLPTLYQANYEVLNRFGIVDMGPPPDYAIIIHPDLK